MRVSLLEVCKNHGEEVSPNHWRNTDFDGTLLQLLVVVDFQYSILNIAEGQLDSGEEYGALRSERQLLLTAVEELNTQLALKLLDSNGNVRLGDTESLGCPGDVLQAGGHLEVFQLSQFHSDSFHSTLLCNN